MTSLPSLPTAGANEGINAVLIFVVCELMADGCVLITVSMSNSTLCVLSICMCILHIVICISL